jgi:hypothetical protein
LTNPPSLEMLAWVVSRKPKAPEVIYKLNSYNTISQL